MSTVSSDLLAEAQWECACTPPGQCDDPAGVDLVATWWPAEVPGTAAGALRLAGVPHPHVYDYDARDWWFRTRAPSPDGLFALEFGGLATLADTWLDSRHLFRSENMYRRHVRLCGLTRGDHEIVIRFAALNPALEVRRPRPRWKSAWTRHQNLRWFRCAMQGRVGSGNLSADLPAIVGPWRPVTLHQVPGRGPRDVELHATPHGDGGTIKARFRMFADPVSPADLQHSAGVLMAAGEEAPLSVEREGDELLFHGRLRVPRVERWWPHTHGRQPLYTVVARIGDQILELGRVGFRTVAADRTDGAFSLSVNGESVFCRGAVWFPPDPMRPHSAPEQLHRTLELLREGNANMVRVPGAAVYEDRRFFDLCDEMGILVWHDCMFAFMDPPQDPSFEHEVELELRENFSAMSGHPSVVVVCGGQEIEEIAAMNGLSADRRQVELTSKLIPSLVEDLLPDVVYVNESPSGGAFPYQTHVGVSHYFGVGGYLRPLEDARLSNVRFAAECLGFATPPEPASMARAFGSARAAGHSPTWKETVHRDSGMSYDFDDVRDFYVEMLFDTDARELRREEPERALTLGRATVAAVMGRTMSEWRRPGSFCGGALVLAACDQVVGGGWGLIDADSWPKAPWYVLRRIFDPVTVLLTDEGVNGLDFHVVNDTAEPFPGTVVVELYAHGQTRIDTAERQVEIPPRGSLTLGTESLLGGFRDVNYVYRFGPPAHDVVLVRLLDSSGAMRAEAVHLPQGEGRLRESSVGLRAEVTGDSTHPCLELSCDRFAQWVVVDVPGFIAADSWFHMTPGHPRTISLTPASAVPPLGPSRGRIRALNAYEETAVLIGAGSS
jgi:beta-mannosidase